MKIEIHNTEHVEISDGVNRIHLEYDDAADFVEAVEAQPNLADGFARVAVSAERQAAISEAANEAVNVRDFGGDQRAAVVAVIEDFGFRVTREIVVESLATADAIWRQFNTGEVMA